MVRTLDLTGSVLCAKNCTASRRLYFPFQVVEQYFSANAAICSLQSGIRSQGIHLEYSCLVAEYSSTYSTRTQVYLNLKIRRWCKALFLSLHMHTPSRASPLINERPQGVNPAHSYSNPTPCISLGVKLHSSSSDARLPRREPLESPTSCHNLKPCCDRFSPNGRPSSPNWDANEIISLR